MAGFALVTALLLQSCTTKSMEEVPGNSEPGMNFRQTSNPEQLASLLKVGMSHKQIHRILKPYVIDSCSFTLCGALCWENFITRDFKRVVHVEFKAPKDPISNSKSLTEEFSEWVMEKPPVIKPPIRHGGGLSEISTNIGATPSS